MILVLVHCLGLCITFYDPGCLVPLRVICRYTAQGAFTELPARCNRVRNVPPHDPHHVARGPSPERALHHTWLNMNKCVRTYIDICMHILNIFSTKDSLNKPSCQPPALPECRLLSRLDCRAEECGVLRMVLNPNHGPLHWILYHIPTM